MRPYVVLHKPRGKTPLEVVNAWKEEQNLSNDFPVAYAGRLDPMAEGKLLILLSDECKRQKEYTNLDKEYVVEVLFDISTDTGDVLGHPMLQKTRTTIQRKELASALMKEHGTHEREYPVFSSKTVSGKPLFLYALEETLDTITIPTHSETIYKTSALEIASLSSEQLKHASMMHFL